MTRTLLLAVATLLGTMPLAHAQTGQAYYGWYPPTAPAMPAPYPTAPAMSMPYAPMPAIPTPYSAGASMYTPVHRMQHPHGYYGHSPSHGHMHRHHAHGYPGHLGYNNGYGVNYYYVQNPMGFSPTPAPYSAVANSRAVGKTVTWPVPGAPEMEPEEPLPPPVPFHRTPNEHCWFSFDYLGMFIRPMRFSGPLITTGSVLDLPPGVLGRASTQVLFGSQPVDYGMMSTIRLEAGFFLDDHNRFSLEASGFYSNPGRFNYSIAADENGNPLIARPIFNTADNREGAFLTSAPFRITGDISADFRSDFSGLEVNARMHEYVKEHFHLDGLLGFRFMNLGERMAIRETLTDILPGFLTFRGAPIGAGNMLIDEDLFRVSNQFYGPQIGARVAWEQKWMQLSAFAKLGLGVTRQNAVVAGSTTVVSPDGAVSQVASGGILALPSNIGTHTRTVFGILPEFGFNLGVDVCQNVRVKVGYSFLFWNHVLRAGTQFDRNINPANVPGSPTFGALAGGGGPAYRFNEEFFWSHAFNIGVEFHY